MAARRILLVDDDLDQREVLEEILLLERAAIQSAGTAEEAIGLLDGTPPEIVLMDLHGVHVEPFVDAVRNQVPRPSLVVLSGDPKVADHAARLGADMYLAKPYDLEDLLRVIRDVLAQRDGVQAHAPA